MLLGQVLWFGGCCSSSDSLWQVWVRAERLLRIISVLLLCVTKRLVTVALVQGVRHPTFGSVAVLVMIIAAHVKVLR